MSTIETQPCRRSPYFTQQGEFTIRTVDDFDRLSEVQQKALIRYGQAVANSFGRERDSHVIPTSEGVRRSAFSTMLFREKQGELHGIPDKLISRVKRDVKLLLREVPIGGNLSKT